MLGPALILEVISAVNDFYRFAQGIRGGRMKLRREVQNGRIERESCLERGKIWRLRRLGVFYEQFVPTF